MKPDARFLNQPKHFWANVRSISQHLGYTARASGQILVPNLDSIVRALGEIELGTGHVVDAAGNPTAFGISLLSYFAHRAELLNLFVEPRLMNAEQAAAAFTRVREETNANLRIPMNKQKGDKRKPAYLTSTCSTWGMWTRCSSERRSLNGCHRL